MDSERWQRVEQLYHSALECEPAKRHAFLAEACEGDYDLRRMLDDLLAQSGATNGLIAQPIWEVVAGSAESADQIRVGTRLGPYERSARGRGVIR